MSGERAASKMVSLDDGISSVVMRVCSNGLSCEMLRYDSGYCITESLSLGTRGAHAMIGAPVKGEGTKGGRKGRPE